MQLSKFTLFVEDYPKKSEYLVYNTRTQALVKVDRELHGLLKGLKPSDDLRLSHRVDDFTALYRMGVIVRDEAEDRERLEKFVDQKKYGVDKSLFMVTILTTYNCNFACTYCFEETTRRYSERLDTSTCDLIIVWMKRRIERIGYEKLIINYYGGEPLLNPEAIDYISSIMKEWCESRGVVFKIMLQTNGALLTPELVDRYVRLGLTSARVSLDGTREENDRQRPMRGSGKGTFDAVMKNVLQVVGKIKVTIVSGYDGGDTRGILDLVDYLDETGVLRKVDFKWAPIHPSLGPKGNAGAIAGKETLRNYETDNLLASEGRIREALKQKGMDVKSGPTISDCPLTKEEGGVTIDTHGTIFKCNAMLGHPELAVGHVREEQYNQLQKEFLASDAWKKCDADCPYMPMCNMGCRLFSFFKTGDFAAKGCERSYMDRYVPEAIKAEYRTRIEEREKERRQTAGV